MIEVNTEIVHNFVVLEGLDGSGTSTQLDLLTSRLLSMNIPHRATFEPTNNPVGTLIRDILSRKTAVRPATLAHLYVSDRHEHLHAAGGILDTAGRGMLAVSDRYLFSSLAYQSIDCGFDYVLRINGIFPLPELLIFIDLEPAICQQRLAERGKAELFDDIQFQQKVRKSYQETFSYFAPTDMQIETVDGTLPPERVHEKIWEIFCKLSIITV